ncbi:LPD7 domain-containing protein [Methylocystis sp.]|uniref:LPD7 domain-containing protein n=1 Tax=Methylocystis sp. TaxID=1911079 RepID=UPI003DA44203
MAENKKDGSRAFEMKQAAGDGGGEGWAERDEDQRRSSNWRAATEFDPLPEHLRRKYYVLDAGVEKIKIYADRSGEYLVAKAGRDRLVTQVASIEIVRDLVAIAAHRGWERIELTGSAEFRREAWLAASARGIEAKGYKPTEIDSAALAKMGGGFERSDKAPSFARDRANAGSQRMRRSSSEPTGRDRAIGSNDRNARSHLAVIERVALAAFPKDAQARKRVHDAARERMAHHRRRGARFDRAEIIEGKGSPSREPMSKAAKRTREADRAEQRGRNR